MGGREEMGKGRGDISRKRLGQVKVLCSCL